MRLPFRRRSFDDHFAEFAERGKVTHASARRLSADQLHEMLYRNKAPAAQSILQSELKVREAWAGPAGRAFWISCAALGVSMAALLVAIIRG